MKGKNVLICETSSYEQFSIRHSTMDDLGELHNNHNVYILGAGFSRLRGLPLVYDFMMQMRDALEFHSARGNRRECEAIRAVLSFRLKSSSAAYRVQVNLENIEELFSLASASPTPMEESIRLAIAATLEFSMLYRKAPIAKFDAANGLFANNRNWSFQEASSGPYSGSWTAPAYEFIVSAMLGERGAPNENTFITFNYDTLLEESLNGLDVPYSLGFSSHSSERSNARVKVLKLHGSIDWAVPKRARTSIQVFENYRSIIEADLTPQLVPPTWKKDSRGVFNEIWNESLKALSNATRVVVIGFSIPHTDLHFKYLLAAGLQDNFSLREIVFVNPGDGLKLVKTRCDELFANQVHQAARVRFVDSTVEHFSGQGTNAFNVWSISRFHNETVQNIQFI